MPISCIIERMQIRLIRAPRLAVISVLVFILGVMGGVAYTLYAARAQINADCVKLYPLTNINIDCGEYSDSSTRLKNIDSTLTDAADLYIKEGKATNISVWVRDLTSLQWASVNENDRYAPASLLKVPLMIAYYKLAEIEPSLLTTKFTYQLSPAQDAPSPIFPPQKLLTVGQDYTVDDLISQMILYSDNNAADVLAAHIDPDIFNNILLELGIKIQSVKSDNLRDFLTAKTYGSIFRNLYNASYLDQAYSQKALDLLSKTTFSGIDAPLPKGTIVAQKFGERGVDNADGTSVRELHDCGIVYKKSQPYSICIMTKGTDEASLLSIIKDFSQITYDKI
jgi:beta-lactamase class A